MPSDGVKHDFRDSSLAMAVSFCVVLALRYVDVVSWSWPITGLVAITTIIIVPTIISTIRDAVLRQ